MKRRLTAGEAEILSLGTMTLTTARVILRRSRWWGETCESVPLGRVDSTSVVVPRWGSPRLAVMAGSLRLVLRHHDAFRLRGMADAIDHATCA